MKLRKRPPTEGGHKANIHLYSNLYSNTHSDDLAGFYDHARAYGLPIPEVIADGKIHRFKVEGDKRGSKNGWYVYFSYPVAAGAVGSWKTGESYTWCSKSGKSLSQAEREALKRQYHQARIQRNREQEQNQQQAQAKAKGILSRAVAADPEHRYLVNKQIQPYNLKQYKDSVLAELRDIDGTLHSLQFIKPDGSKFFLKNGRIKGCFHAFGDLEGASVVHIAEGISTAATVHGWQKTPVLAAMNAGNLLPVGLAVRQAYPDIRIVFAGDNDRFNPAGNVGKDKATEAARICNGLVLLPEFPKGSTGTDWNDYFCQQAGGVSNE
ncbi:MAG: toprim domain-containing protein [Thiolinea sp.]